MVSQTETTSYLIPHEGDQKVFCSPSSGLPNPRRLTSATTIRGISRPGAVPSGLFSRPPHQGLRAFHRHKAVTARQFLATDAPAAAKARSAQVLRNSPRIMPLSSSWSQDTLNPFSTRKNKLFPKLTYCWLHTTSDSFEL